MLKGLKKEITEEYHYNRWYFTFRPKLLFSGLFGPMPVKDALGLGHGRLLVASVLLEQWWTVGGGVGALGTKSGFWARGYG